MNYETLQKVVYQAFLKAIQETGDDYKQMSWFPRNKPDIRELTTDLYYVRKHDPAYIAGVY